MVPGRPQDRFWLHHDPGQDRAQTIDEFIKEDKDHLQPKVINTTAILKVPFRNLPQDVLRWKI